MFKQRGRFWTGGILMAALALFLAASAGRVLVRSNPQKSDTILVLAGETDFRPQLGLKLLDQGYGKTLMIDVPAGQQIYQYTELALAESYFRKLPEADSIRICPIVGLSTRDESHDVAKCLTDKDRRIVIVTSDYHTRRALSIFRHELTGRSFSVAAAYDPREYGVDWWRHREWAKTFFDECLKFLWWNGVDRWR